MIKWISATKIAPTYRFLELTQMLGHSEISDIGVEGTERSHEYGPEFATQLGWPLCDDHCLKIKLSVVFSSTLLIYI